MQIDWQCIKGISAPIGLDLRKTLLAISVPGSYALKAKPTRSIKLL
jgi:hypothetical protein